MVVQMQGLSIYTVQPSLIHLDGFLPKEIVRINESENETGPEGEASGFLASGLLRRHCTYIIICNKTKCVL